MATTTGYIDYTEQGSTPTTPSTGHWRIYTTASGLFVVDDAGATTGPMLDETAHDSLDHTGLTGVGSGTGAFVGCVAQRTTDQTLTTSTGAAVSFTGTDVIDTDAFHNPASNAERITIPTGKAGKYRFHAFVPFASNATGTRQVAFVKNAGGAGEATLDVDRRPANAGGVLTYMTVTSRVVELAEGDYMTVYAEQNSGGNLAVAGATLACVFSAQFLGT